MTVLNLLRDFAYSQIALLSGGSQLLQRATGTLDEGGGGVTIKSSSGNLSACDLIRAVEPAVDKHFDPSFNRGVHDLFPQLHFCALILRVEKDWVVGVRVGVYGPASIESCEERGFVPAVPFHHLYTRVGEPLGGI